MYHGEYNLSVSQSPKKLPNPLAKLSISWAFCSLGPNRKVLELRRWLGNVALFFSGASEKAGWDCDHGASCEYDLPWFLAESHNRCGFNKSCEKEVNI